MTSAPFSYRHIPAARLTVKSILSPTAKFAIVFAEYVIECVGKPARIDCVAARRSERTAMAAEQNTETG